ncbi:MAG: hypothetical protein R6U15_04945 [Candidatus Izemoplasmatales bacterium]
MSDKPNKIIKYLSGKWNCKNIVIKPKEKPREFSYKETIKIKNNNTISITAFGIDNGNDFTKDMQIDLSDNHLTLSQDDFSVAGKYFENFAELVNENYRNNKYLIRIFLLEENYIYQMEVYNKTKLISSQFSYLTKIK